MDEKEPPTTSAEEPPDDPPAAVQWMIQQAAASQLRPALPAPLENLPLPALAPTSGSRRMTEREQRIAGALRGNDQLTDGLPDAAADSLLEWGLELAQGIVRDTADLADEAAEDILQPRVRAVRRLMMAVGRATDDEAPAAFEAWLEQAAIALGERFVPPSAAQTQDLRRQWQALAGRPQEQIALARGFLGELTISRS